MIWSLGFVFFTVAIFLLIGLFIGEGFPSYTLYIGVFILGFYLYRSYKASQALKQEYRASVSQRPKDITLTISEDDFTIHEDSVQAANGWHNFNGMQKYNNNLVIGYSDRKALLLDHDQLSVEQKRKIIALVESKFARKHPLNIASYITVPLMAMAGTAFGAMFVYTIYDLITDPKSMAKIIVMGLMSLMILGLSFSSFFLMKRAWESRND